MADYQSHSGVVMLERLNRTMVKIHIFCFVFSVIGAFAVGSGSILADRH